MVWTVTYNFKDEKGKTSSTEMNLPDATSVADVRLFAQQFAVLLNDLTTGALTKVTVSLDVTPSSGVRTVAAAGSDVEEGGRFQFNVTGGFYTHMRVPTFDESKVNAGSSSINLTDADVAAYTTAMATGLDLTAAGGSGVIQPCDKRGTDVTGLSSASEQFLSS